jgi:hypothetical protein
MLSGPDTCTYMYEADEIIARIFQPSKQKSKYICCSRTFDWEETFAATRVLRLGHARPPLVGAVADEPAAAVHRKAHGPPVDALLHQRRPRAPEAAAASALPARNDAAQGRKEQKHLHFTQNIIGASALKKAITCTEDATATRRTLIVWDAPLI